MKPKSRKSPQSTPRPSGSHRWVIGIHSCEEVLRIRPGSVRQALIRSDLAKSPALAEVFRVLERRRIQPHLCNATQLDKIGSGHQGLAIEVSESPRLDWANLEGSSKVVTLILDGIEDPQNLGSIMRTAWLMGVAAIFVPEDRATGLTPTVCKVACGGAEHVPIERFSNISVLVDALKKRGFWVYGLAEAGQRHPWQFNLPEKMTWIVGSESGGMRTTTERACDELVRLPQVKSGSSYNAAIAVAMALSDTARQFGNLE